MTILEQMVSQASATKRKLKRANSDLNRFSTAAAHLLETSVHQDSTPLMTTREYDEARFRASSPSLTRRPDCDCPPPLP